MPKQRPDYFAKLLEFSSLRKYPLKTRIKIRMADLAMFTLIKSIGATITYEIVDLGSGKVASWKAYETDDERDPCNLVAFWHNRIFLTTHYMQYRKGAILVSESFEGEFAARTAQRFGYGAIRGSSTRGGTRSLKQMFRLLKLGLTMVITVDGPLGPKYVVKPGIVGLAKQTGVPIIPFLIEPKRFWTINSWDKMQIPTPFTTARVIFAKPMYVDRAATAAEMDSKLEELQQTMDDLVKRGAEWRKTQMP